MFYTCRVDQGQKVHVVTRVTKETRDWLDTREILDLKGRLDRLAK